MRIRSTKPEFWRSRRIAAVEWEIRFVLKGLESYVDDNGVGKDDLELIVSDIFSRDLAREPSRTLKRVQVAVDTLFAAGLIHRYTADDTDLLYISWWDSTQYINRPSKGRLRRPDGTFDYGESEIGAPDLSPQEASSSFSAGTGEQGNRGTGEQLLSAAADASTKKPSRATQRPADFRPTQAHMDLAAERGVDLANEWEKFCDWTDANGKTYKDWSAALRNWIRNARPSHQPGGRPTRHQADEEMFARMAARAEAHEARGEIA